MAVVLTCLFAKMRTTAPLNSSSCQKGKKLRLDYNTSNICMKNASLSKPTNKGNDWEIYIHYKNHLNSPKKISLRKHNQGEGGNSSGTVSLPSNVKFQC